MRGIFTLKKWLFRRVILLFIVLITFPLTGLPQNENSNNSQLNENDEENDFLIEGLGVPGTNGARVDSAYADFYWEEPTCYTSPVQFFDNSWIPDTINHVIEEWFWEFGDGNDSTFTLGEDPNVAYQYSDPGDYDVSLTITTDAGYVDSVTYTVGIDPVPVANFSWDNNCEGETVQFTNLTQQNGSGSVTFVEWDFGDPASGSDNTSDLWEPSHTYEEPGQYAVTLTVGATNGCSNTTVDTVTIKPSPSVAFTTRGGSCAGSNIEFEISQPRPEEIQSVLWDFDDGNTSTGLAPSHAYETGGTYDVNLAVTDTSGCTGDTTQPVEVLSIPEPDFTASANTCASDPVEFSDQSEADEQIDTWLYEFGDGNDTTFRDPPGNFTYQYNDAGTFNVTLTITTVSGCVNDTVKQVTTLQTPVADFGFNGNCENEAVAFQDGSQAAGGTEVSTWSWDFGDPSSGSDNFSNVPNPFHDFTAADTFDVQLEVGNLAGCYDTIVKQVPISQPPEAGISVTSSTCQNTVTYFAPDTSVVDTPAIAVYEWSFGDGTGTSGQYVEHTYSTYGEYDVTLTVIDTVGCSASATTTISVSETPTAVFSYDEACQGGATQFTDYSYIANDEDAYIETWYWSFNDPAAPDSASNHSSNKDPLHVYDTSGTYPVTLVVTTNTGCVDSVTNNVTVQPNPIAWYEPDTAACGEGRVNFYDMSTSENSTITNWQWNFEPGYGADIPNPSYTFSQVDSTYNVQLVATDAHGCKDTVVRPVSVPKGYKADFSFNKTCLGSPTVFQPELVSPDGDSIIFTHWKFGDGSQSAEYTPEHMYLEAGNYAVTLKATNTSYCIDSITKNIRVYDVPDPAFSYNSYSCDSNVYMVDETTPSDEISTWIWRWGDGSPNDTINAPFSPDISHQYVEPGDYPVSLTVINDDGCSNTVSDSVYRKPCSNFMVSTSPVCQNNPVTFVDSTTLDSENAEWKWIFGDGSDTTIRFKTPNVYHTYDTTGLLQVSLITRTTAGGGQPIVDTITKTINIRPSPTAQYSYDTTCVYESMNFADITNTDTADVVQWHWDFGVDSLQSDTSVLKEPSYNYDNYGTYAVRLQVINEFGCQDSVVQDVPVHQKPEAEFVFDTACSSYPNYFYDMTDTTGFVGRITHWHWDFGLEGDRSDTANISEPQFTYEEEGTHEVRLEVEDIYGCRDTVNKTVVTHPSPTASFEIEKDYEDKPGRFNIMNNSEDVDYYEWDITGIDWEYDTEYHEDDFSPVILFSEDGLYELQLVIWNDYNCADTMKVSDSLLFRGLYVPNAFAPDSPQEGVQEFKPVGQNIKEDTYSIKIFDVKGNLLWESRELDDEGAPAEGWDGTFEGDPLPQGVYVWKIEAVFQDGTVWKGNETGTSEFSSGQRQGTLTLIR